MHSVLHLIRLFCCCVSQATSMSSQMQRALTCRQSQMSRIRMSCKRSHLMTKSPFVSGYPRPHTWWSNEASHYSKDKLPAKALVPATGTFIACYVLAIACFTKIYTANPFLQLLLPHRYHLCDETDKASAVLSFSLGASTRRSTGNGCLRLGHCCQLR